MPAQDLHDVVEAGFARLHSRLDEVEKSQRLLLQKHEAVAEATAATQRAVTSVEVDVVNRITEIDGRIREMNPKVTEMSRQLDVLMAGENDASDFMEKFKSSSDSAQPNGELMRKLDFIADVLRQLQHQPDGAREGGSDFKPRGHPRHAQRTWRNETDPRASRSPSPLSRSRSRNSMKRDGDRSRTASPGVSDLPTAADMRKIGAGVSEIRDNLQAWLRVSGVNLQKSDENVESLVDKVLQVNQDLADFKEAMLHNLNMLQASLKDTKEGDIASLSNMLKQHQKDNEKLGRSVQDVLRIANKQSDSSDMKGVLQAFSNEIQKNVSALLPKGSNKLAEEQGHVQHMTEAILDIRNLLSVPKSGDLASGPPFDRILQLVEKVLVSCETHQRAELEALGGLKDDSAKLHKAVLDLEKTQKRAQSASVIDDTRRESECDTKSSLQSGIRSLEAKQKETVKLLESLKSLLDEPHKMAKVVEKRIHEQAKSSLSETKNFISLQLDEHHKKFQDLNAKEHRSAATDVKKCVANYVLQAQQKILEKVAAKEQNIQHERAASSSSNQGIGHGVLKDSKRSLFNAHDHEKSVASTSKKPGKRKAASSRSDTETSLTPPPPPPPETAWSKVCEELSKQTAVSSEIFNSIEDMKQLNSSMPNTLHDEVLPALERIVKVLSEIPTEQFLAALEENMCNNIVKEIALLHQATLQEVFVKFDTMEQRMAIIKKYAKYGSSGCPDKPNPMNSPTGNPTSNNDTSSAGPMTNGQIMQHITQRHDLLAQAVTEPLGKIEKSLEELLVVERQILSEQAKGLVVEEQLEATTHSVIQNIKPDIQQLVDFYKTDVRELLEQPLAHMPNVPGTPLPKAAVVLLNRMEEQLAQKIDDGLTSQKEMLLAIEEKLRAEAAVKPDSELSPPEALHRLVSCVGKLSVYQQEILARADQTIDFQTELNETFREVVLSLETIRSLLQQENDVVGDQSHLSELCLALQTKIKSLDELEKALSVQKSQGCEDMREIVQKSTILVNSMLRDQALLQPLNAEKAEAQHKSISAESPAVRASTGRRTKRKAPLSQNAAVIKRKRAVSASVATTAEFPPRQVATNRASAEKCTSSGHSSANSGGVWASEEIIETSSGKIKLKVAQVRLVKNVDPKRETLKTRSGDDLSASQSVAKTTTPHDASKSEGSVHNDR